MSFLIIAALLGGIVVVGGVDLVEAIDRGVIRNRRGPDVTPIGSPVLFWVLIAFFGAGVTLCAGLSALCVSIAARAAFGERADRTEPHD